MAMDTGNNDAALLKTVGERIAALRLARNMTQEQMAEDAGLALRTVQRLELGAVATQLSGFLRVCRVLGLVERMDAFLPPPVSSPMQQLRQAGRVRRRATGHRPESKPGTWTWAERP
jgi:transcriptional regulator with XRE-family HTH domain